VSGRPYVVDPLRSTTMIYWFFGGLVTWGLAWWCVAWWCLMRLRAARRQQIPSLALAFGLQSAFFAGLWAVSIAALVAAWANAPSD
jgi:hypothetical protein